MLTHDESHELETLIRMVDEAVVVRNQLLRAERELEIARQQVEKMSRGYSLIALRIEKQREKMELARVADRARVANSRV